jgi:hypothetical protein
VRGVNNDDYEFDDEVSDDDEISEDDDDRSEDEDEECDSIYFNLCKLNVFCTIVQIIFCESPPKHFPSTV